MRRLFAASFALVVLALPMQAQVSCTNPGDNATLGDACALASDYYRYVGTQLGTAVTGGTHTLGIGTALGGLPHFALALRANAVYGNFPTVSDISVGPAGANDYEVEQGGAAMVAVDGALGIFKGISLGVTRVGGVDLLAGVTYVPEIDGDDYKITPDNPISIGYGVRVGLLEQSALIPGVAVSYLIRDLPTLDMEYTNGTDQISLQDFSVKTKSWRLTAQKNLLLFQLFAGIGGDSYDLSVDASVTADGNTAGFADAFAMDRTTMFGGIGFNLFLVKVVAEVGQVSGGSVTTYNNFDTAADASRLYGSAGIRISF